ncbi:MAG: phosphate acyltransferase PlsX [Candidatus Puniceispirillaceae bacterium]
MTKQPRLALDAMGGDNAPRIVVEGADIAVAKNPDLTLVFVGDERKIKPLLKATRYLQSAEILHTTEEVAPEARVSQVLRAGKQTSMWKAIELVAEGQVEAVVSAGNTGALMAMSKLQLRMIEGVSRPAIAGFFPSSSGHSCVLDLGANIECDAENLIQFAIMGSAFYRDIYGMETPSVGLLNVGEEDQKGFDYLREAAKVLNLEKLDVNYQGFVEGSDITAGSVDVIVTDGFTGNAALKTAEGVANLFQQSMRDAFSASLMTKLGYLLARAGFTRLRAKLDPRNYNGAVFLGLNGISVKSHGGTDAIGYANAINVAVNMVKQGFIPEVTAAIATANQIFAEEKMIADDE